MYVNFLLNMKLLNCIINNYVKFKIINSRLWCKLLIYIYIYIYINIYIYITLLLYHNEKLV